MLKTLKATLIAGAAALAAASVATPAQAADQFRVEITNMRSGLKADVIWASQAEHQGVFLWPNNSSASQEFDLLDSGGGYFRIRARHSGQCLMLVWSTGSYTNGTPVIQHPYCAGGYASAEWRVGWASPPRLQSWLPAFQSSEVPMQVHCCRIAWTRGVPPASLRASRHLPVLRLIRTGYEALLVEQTPPPHWRGGLAQPTRHSAGL